MRVIGVVYVALGIIVLIFHKRMALSNANWFRAWARLLFRGYATPEHPTLFDWLCHATAFIGGFVFIAIGVMALTGAAG